MINVLMFVLLGPGFGNATASGGLSALDLDTCLEIAGLGSIETGTCGTLVLSDSPTFVDDFDLGAAGVRLSGVAGVLTFKGLGPGSFDEDLKLDLDATTNTGAFTSTTGLTTLTFAAIDISVGGFTTIAANGNIDITSGGRINLEGTAGDTFILRTGNQISLTDDGTTSMTVSSTAIVGVGTITSSGNDAGWSVVDQSDNQACTTGCTFACLFGFNVTAGNVTGLPLTCADTAADVCICMGAN
jgi:hypothetical protein